MAKLYKDSTGTIQCALDENAYICDESVGVGSWCIVEDSVWIAAQHNNNNTLIDGVFTANHISSVTYWMPDGTECVCEHGDTMPEDAVTEKPSIVKEAEFKKNREIILNSVTWMHERAQSQISLVNAGLLSGADWTLAQYNEYLQWKQGLRAIPQGGDNWMVSITYPSVPSHVYEDMKEHIQSLCTTLGCAPS